MAKEVRAKYMDGLKDVDVKEPAIPQRWSTIREDVQRLRRRKHIRNVNCHWLQDEIGYVAKDAKRRGGSRKGRQRSLMFDIIGSCWRKHGMSFHS